MANLVTLIIGHRGTGKSSFVKRLRDVRAIDLDQVIEQRFGKPIGELLNAGEPQFRRIEADTLQKLVETAIEPTVIAAGAGIERVPEAAHVVWLRRETDRDGRSFLNRPRLDEQLSPFEEYMERFSHREKRYRTWAHEELVLPEGYFGGLESFLSSALVVPYDLTLLPENFRNFETFIAKRLAWGVRRFELREDLLSAEQMKVAQERIPPDRQMISHHASESGSLHDGAKIFSLHERGVDLAADLDRLASRNGAILKAAPEVHSFAELEAGHLWWLKDPLRRAFLPRSVDGRWRWYRSLFGPQMPIHFFREGEGSSLDQPLLWQCALQPRLQHDFAAVLGFPIHHSRTPMEQHEFFAQRHMPVVAIPIQEDLASALPVLRRLGLSHAAVTSPLKTELVDLAQELSPEARTLRSANTLQWRDDGWVAHNTDYLALKELAQQYPDSKSVWVWGRGSLRETVVKVWPQAKLMSARLGTDEGAPPDLLIWATNRSRTFQWPQLQPQTVLDLNYGDDSPGLELAVRRNLPYQSGLKMFKLQAEFQRQFWSQA